jgi:hypothetical protein
MITREDLVKKLDEAKTASIAARKVFNAIENANDIARAYDAEAYRIWLIAKGALQVYDKENT